MPDFSKKPDDKFILDAHAYLTSTWRDTHADWVTLDSFLHRTYPVWLNISDAEKVERPDYRPGKPATIVKSAVNQMMALHPKVHRNPVGTSANKEEDANQAEDGLAAVLTNSAMKAMDHPWKTGAAHLIQYSYAVFGILPKFPRNGVVNGKRVYVHSPNFNPIEITAPNPATILMDPTDKEPPFSIRQGKMPAIKISELSQNKVQTRKNAVQFDMTPYLESPFTEVEFTEYWSERWHAFSVPEQQNGNNAVPAQLLWVERNPLGFMPYTHAFAGIGMAPSDLDKTDPKYQARGILWDVMDSIRLQAQSRNAKMQALIDSVFAPLLTTGDAEELKQNLARGNDIIPVEDPDGIRPMQTNQIARWIFEIDREFSDDVEEGTSSRSLGGIRTPGVVTVGQQNQLDTSARAQFNLPLAQLENMATIIGSRVFHLVDNMKQMEGVIGAQGKHLRKSWLHGEYNCDIGFEPTNPALNLQKREVGLREVEGGGKDWETYWEEDEGVTNTSERWSRLARQQVRLSPEMWSLFLQEEAEDLGVGDEFEATQQAQAQAEAGAGSNGAAPGLPPGVNARVSRALRQSVDPRTVSPGRIPGGAPGGTQ
jgi:hypothetical protein